MRQINKKQTNKTKQNKIKKRKVLNTPSPGSLLPVSIFSSTDSQPQCGLLPNPHGVSLMTLSPVVAEAHVKAWHLNGSQPRGSSAYLMENLGFWALISTVSHLWTLVLLLETGKDQSQSTHLQFSTLKSK